MADCPDKSFKSGDVTTWSQLQARLQYLDMQFELVTEVLVAGAKVVAIDQQYQRLTAKVQELEGE